MQVKLMFIAAVMATALWQSSPSAVAQTETSRQQEQRDGQHDWDTFFGTWKMHLKRRLRPLTGSNEWQEFESHDKTRRVWGGRANLDELEADGPSGHIEGLTVRLYNPRGHQWSIYWANASAPTLDIPTIGAFRNGRGEFYDHEMFHDRAIFVRFVWTNVSDKSGDFEQSFSEDGGKTWESNWVTTMERETPSHANVPPNPDNHNGQHDFDFELGRWKVHLKRLTDPLSGSTQWKESDGSINVSKVWNGRANIAELEAANGNEQIEGLSVSAIRSSYAPVESLVGQCGRRGAGPRPCGWQFRKWAWRIFQFSTNQGTLGAGAICFFRHHCQFPARRTVVLDRWRKKLGTELD